MNDLEDIFKKMTNKTKGIWLIASGVVFCTGGFLLTDLWASNMDLLWNIKNSYIMLVKDRQSLTGGIRIPFSMIFFISIVSIIVGTILIILDKDKNSN